MTHASSPAAAMVGERARLLEPRAEGGDKPRGSAFRASVALVAMLAVSAIAAFGMLRSPEDVAVSPLGVSLEDEATLQSVLNAHEPRMAATASNEGLSLGDLEDMAALLGQQHPAGDSASEVAESAEEEAPDEEAPDEEAPEEEAPEEEAPGEEAPEEEAPEEEAPEEEAPGEEEEEEVADDDDEEEVADDKEEEEVVDDDEEEEVPDEEESDEVVDVADEEEEEVPEEEDSEAIADDSDDSEGASLGLLPLRARSALKPNPARAASWMRVLKPSATDGDAKLGAARPKDSSGSNARTDSSWTAPTYFITLGRPGESSAIKPAVRWLAESFGGDAVRRNVRATPGVDVSEWPQNIDFAQYAVSGVLARARLLPDNRARADEAILRDLPWLDILTQRDASTGAVTDPELLSRGHHFGCLFAHIAQWQMAADSGNADTMVFESDGFIDGLLGVPASALGAVQANAPADYDVVFLHHPGEGPQVGDKVKEFTSERGDEVEMFTYEHPDGPSGLSGYMFSDRFVRKMLPLIASRGADMVDAWVAGHLCRPLPENDWAYNLPNYAGANGGRGVQWGEKFLNCYKVMTKGATLPAK
jgi:outer membrane biosynthesis protein TonB